MARFIRATRRFVAAARRFVERGATRAQRRYDAWMANPPSLGQTLWRWCALSLLFGCAVATMLSVYTGASLEEFGRTAAISVFYSAVIGLPGMLIFPRMRPRLHGRPVLGQWLAYLGVLMVITLAGTLVAGLVLVALGMYTLDDLWRGYVPGLEISLAIAVPITVGAATLSKLHDQLAAKELERQRALGLATEARLASLESRVRPHFLFNALNSAIALIPEDPARAESVLERLARLLRFSLDAVAATVTLGEELRVVADYLEIERVRFGDRLRYDIDVPDALRGAVIPAFAVQTLVENSVKYAVSARKAGAHIVVRARRDGDRLRLDVTDDGPGFAGPIWLPGHGLDGLRARLHALYGGAASVVAPAEAGAVPGASVRLELPEVAS